MTTQVLARPLRALVVDDHPLIRKSIYTILSNIPDFSCDEAENGKIALEKCRQEDYNIIFLDIGMPVMDGMTVMRHIREEFPLLKVIILTMHDNNKRQLIELMELGISGYLLKDTDEVEIRKAVDMVMNGDQYITPIVYKTWTDYLVEKSARTQTGKSPNLSQRELEVLQMICMQLSAAEIGDRLCLSDKTINNHRSSIMRKINIHSTVGLVIYAIKNNIFTL